MAVYAFEDRTPEIDESAFVHEQASVIGSVELGAQCSVWPQAVLRGDNDRIVIGPGANVQDGAVLHTDPGFILEIAAGVSIGHQAMLHGCHIGENSLIGIQAVILNGAVIGANCLVGACALVTENKKFPDGSLILGSPARVERELTAEEISRLGMVAKLYTMRASRYRSALTRLA